MGLREGCSAIQQSEGAGINHFPASVNFPSPTPRPPAPCNLRGGGGQPLPLIPKVIPNPKVCPAVEHGLHVWAGRGHLSLTAMAQQAKEDHLLAVSLPGPGQASLNRL